MGRSFSNRYAATKLSVVPAAAVYAAIRTLFQYAGAPPYVAAPPSSNRRCLSVNTAPGASPVSE
jgi:hypothetical protein